MKKYVTAFLAFLVLAACKTRQDEALKSTDKEFILKVANENFEKKKWKNALALYDRLPNLVAGTDEAPNVVFNSAYANYYDKNYKLAGHQFKNFSVSFPQDPRKEEASYMSALCYYQGSMDYNLDQSSTELAINELQDFLNNYPDSERSKNISKLIDELSYKLEYKAYENSRQYYKMADYKAANASFENVLADFPATKLRPNIYDYMLKSRYELAMNSIYDLKRERIDNAIAFSKQVEKELPDSEYSRTAADLRTKLMTESEKFAKVQEDVEKQKTEAAKRQNISKEKLEKDEKEKEIAKQQNSDENNANMARKDSAQIATPPPAATFKIKR